MHSLSEHISKTIKKKQGVDYSSIIPRYFKNERGSENPVFKLQEIEEDLQLTADYYVGIDWLIEGEEGIYVEPKINTKVAEHFNKQLVVEEEANEAKIKEENVAARKDIENAKEKAGEIVELNYLEMLLEVMNNAKTAKKTPNLVMIDWEQAQIPIIQQQDKLTPFLVIQFLQLVKTIVRKGPKKSYYKKQENLRNRTKGKILVGQNIKQNIFKNKFISTYCEYQVFGEDNLENRFLKKVLRFCTGYVENNKSVFGNKFKEIEHIINYSRPAFEHIGEEINNRKLKHLKHNPFFKEYKEAIKIGDYILKKFAYNITKTSDQEITTPPFWIDMPYLFELYFYSKLLKHNPEHSKEIHFQFSTYGNALDFLISAEKYQMIIDTKYKMHYKWGKVHQDIRQVSGYARLNKVRKQLEIQRDKIIDCLILYPDPKDGLSLCDEDKAFSLENIQSKKQKIDPYHKVYKLGVKLPTLSPKLR